MPVIFSIISDNLFKSPPPPPKMVPNSHIQLQLPEAHAWGMLWEGEECWFLYLLHSGDFFWYFCWWLCPRKMIFTPTLYNVFVVQYFEFPYHLNCSQALYFSKQKRKKKHVKRAWCTRKGVGVKWAKQRLFFSLPTPTLSNLLFCTSIQFSRDSISATNYWIKIRENRGLWTF